MENISLIEQMGWRFLRAGLAGAISTASVFTYYNGVTTWEQFQSATIAFSIACLIGFFTGLIMAVDKYFTGTTISTES